MSATITQLLKAEAYRLGFSYCGVARAGFLEEEAPRLEAWLAQGRHGTMAWMANHFDKRLDPRLLVEGARSVVSLLYNYAPQPGTGQPTDAGYKVSCYAWGQDYHTVVKTKLFALLNYLRAQAGDVQGRAFVDSAPVMDKAWARRAGAGWIGKHTNLIRPRAGSYFFIAELIVDIDLVADGPVKDYCGTCTRCIDACPTDALTPYQLDATRCISYLTIELREAIPTHFAGQMEGWAFGCDICQQVCPWNRFATPHQEPAFAPIEPISTFTKTDWDTLTDETFKTVFKSSPLARAKYSGFRRNMEFSEW